MNKKMASSETIQAGKVTLSGIKMLSQTHQMSKFIDVKLEKKKKATKK
jgi:hypothetical protein